MTQQMTTIDKFKNQIVDPSVQGNLGEFLPEKALRKFTAVTIRAVQENTDLLNADRKSLFLACQRAAQDNLMPDGKEGALVMYGKRVQWQPMIAGIRKKLKDADFDMRAEIVYEKDEFSVELGDNPQIIHRPKPFGDRGPIVGAYAIATNLKDGEKYRETMDIEELEKVRLSSRGSNSPAWKVWKTEMYRKTVAKRLYKYLPVSEDTVLDLIERDNEQFETFSGVSDTAKDVQAKVRAVQEEEPIEGEIVEPEPKKKKTKKKKTTKKELPPEGPTDMPPAPPPEEDDELGF